MEVEITYDKEVDAAYVSLGATEVRCVKQIEAYHYKDRYEIILDLDADNHLVGLEIIGAIHALLPSILKNAITNS